MACLNLPVNTLATVKGDRIECKKRPALDISRLAIGSPSLDRAAFPHATCAQVGGCASHAGPLPGEQDVELHADGVVVRPPLASAAARRGDPAAIAGALTSIAGRKGDGPRVRGPFYFRART